MLPPTQADDDAPILGSGQPPERRKNEKKKERSIFDLPESPEEMMQDGEATAEYVRNLIGRLRAEGADVRCGACIVGDVQSALPDLSTALSDAGVADPSRVEGLWVVPPFVLKGLGKSIRWHEARGRLGPFLKNDVWRRVDADVRQGRAVDWVTMGLQPENLVVVKHRATWRQMIDGVRTHLTWRAVTQLARSAYAGATRRNAAAAIVRMWPFKWSWLVAWVLIDMTIWSSHVVTANIVPIGWQDVFTLWLGNVMVFAYAMRARATADQALADAEAFKTAGSVALRRANLEVAVQQYTHGDESAAKLAAMWQLNSAFAARGPLLRVACLNNAAIVHLKQKDWEAAAAVCTRALRLSPTSDALGRAKSHFRYALAQAKLGAVGAAIASLHLARELVPSDREVVGMLRVLEMGEQRRLEREYEAREDGEAMALEEELKAAGGLAAARAAYGAMLDPAAPSDVSHVGVWAPADAVAEGAAAEEADAGKGSTSASASAAAAPAATTAPAVTSTGAPATGSGAPKAVVPKAHPLPPASTTSAHGPRRVIKFAWAQEQLRRRLVGVACQDEDGCLVAVRGVSAVRGEAYVEHAKGGKKSRTFDLSFTVEWQAKLGETICDGELRFGEVSSSNEPDEFEVEALFGVAAPDEGTPERMDLIGLLGPLRHDKALAAEGRLTQQVWMQLLEFCNEFAALNE